MSHHSTDSELRHLWFGGLPAPQADRLRRRLSRYEECLSRLIEIDGRMAGAEPPGDFAGATDERHTAAMAS
jgi:hypothetical protein